MSSSRFAPLFQGRVLKGLAPSLAALLLATTGCDGPPVAPTADLRQNTETARIEGQVVVQSQARGNVVVLLYAAERPPPPAGSGRPISFTLIPMEKVFGQDLDRKDASGKYTAGPFTAPFAFSLVPEGKYLVRGFVDADTCRRVPVPATCHGSDFNPFYGVTGEPNQFDVGGAAVDLNDPRRAPLVVSVGRDGDGKLVPALGVSVSFADTALVPFDRPAFEASGPVSAGALQLVTLKPLKVLDGGVNQAPAAFFVRYVDDNGDGVADDKDGNGAPDLWPRVVVRKLSSDKSAVPLLTDENDLDRNGILDVEGASYTAQDGSTDASPDLVVMAAGLVPTGLYPLLNNEDGTPKKNPDGSFPVVPVPSLTVAIQPAALNAANAAAPVRLASVPPGAYSVLLMQFTGQTWKVPNELAPALSENLGFPSVAGQDFRYEVAATP